MTERGLLYPSLCRSFRTAYSLMRILACLMFVVEMALASPVLESVDTRAPIHSEQSYYWKTDPVGASAELFTLFCKSCTVGSDVPVVSVLRDTLGDADPKNDRLVYVWLLDYTRDSWSQRLLAAVPFFYWKVSNGSEKPERGDVGPLLDLTSPIHPIINQANRQLLQWTVFDPMTMMVRASSRAYSLNSADDERVHIEQAITYLEQSPADKDGSGLSKSDLDLVIARLSLRRRLLGGLVSERNAPAVGDRERIEAERVRERNWELLRQCADKTGLLFEPLTLSGTKEEYALLWYPEDSRPPARPAVDVGSTWKLLNVKNPWKDDALAHWKGPRFTRTISGEKKTDLIPLAAYNLNYPRMPLLVVDFQDGAHVRRHELVQRGINELTAGVIGVSHFANWYYFAGADMYDFVASRRGTPQNATARLDCYAQFRTALVLDNSLPASLRTEMQKRVEALTMNPMDESSERQVDAASARYDKLRTETQNGELLRRLDLERRAELASFERGRPGMALDMTLHTLTLGAYTHRVSKETDTLEALDRYRRAQANLNFLAPLAAAGTAPEVAFEPGRIEASVHELSSLLPGLRSSSIKQQATAVLTTLGSLTEDATLKSDCLFALEAMKPASGLGVAAQPRVLTKAAIPAAEPVK